MAYAAGAAVLPKVAIPAVLRFGLGAAILSLVQFFLLLFGWGSFPYPLGFVLIAWVIYKRPLLMREPVSKPLDTVSRWIIFPVFAAYAIFYLVNALAPEIQPDAISYHLALPAQYLRLGHFPARIGFYEMLPQGLEMLFTVAIAHGGYSSAKLVHFAFLLATLPLLVMVARRLQFSDLAGYAAATLYFVAPVVGISGSSAYNDAALVFYTLATFYLLLRPLPNLFGYLAGILAGFCFAVKFTGLLVPVLALGYLIYRRQPVIRFCTGAALMIAPWMLRDLVLTGNPLAPLLNSWFPNPYFSASGDRALAATITSYGGFHWTSAPWNWAFGGSFQGIVGPLMFMIPIALLAWRRRSGRIVLAGGILLLIPVLFNVGTRFLMPALPLFALAVTISLPRPAIWACILLQAVLCYPAVLNAWGKPYGWILKDFPWQAALRLEPERAYLQKQSGEYAIARMVEAATTPQDRIFTLTTIGKAYTTRESLEFWHNTQARQLTDAIQAALHPPSIERLSARWPVRLLHSVRVVAKFDQEAELHVYDMRFYSSGSLVYPSPNWFMKASPNLWDAPLALDGNRATYWSSLSPQRAGMFLETDFDHPQLLDATQLLVERTNTTQSFMVQGQERRKAAWLTLTGAFSSAVSKEDDLRHEAGRSLKSAGFTYLLTEIGKRGLAPVGEDLLKHPREWGAELTVRLGDVCLFHLL